MATSDLVLGAMFFGTRSDRATSYALLDRFVEAGGTTVDTANCYAFWVSDTGSGGQSEAVVGDWLRLNQGLRDDLIISTKVGMEPLVPGVSDGRVEGLSAEVVARECDLSRDRLGVESIDVYWAHGEDRSVPLEETVTAFGGLVTSGYVDRVGFSNHPTWRVERARAIALADGMVPPTALQLTTSYVRPRPDVAVPGKDHRFGFVTDETVDYVTEHPEIELWAYSPLIQGSYDRVDRPFPEAYDHPGTTRRLEALTRVADRLGVTRGQLVLAWLLSSTPEIRPIVGVSSVGQLDEALDAATLELSPELLKELDTAS
jgi:aryl-alcohol dehydrogenase-like predicted oxidoreductase